MEVESVHGASDPEASLRALAAGGELEPPSTWPLVRDMMLARLDENARQAFPVPNLPPPRSHSSPEQVPSPVASSPILRADGIPTANATNTTTTTTASGENGWQEPDQRHAATVAEARSDAAAPAVQQLGPDELPVQLEDMLQTVKDHVLTFETHPPHTIQRLAELVLHPRSQYNALAAYLHAVDRVATVTSSVKVYPLPPVNQDVAMLGGPNGAQGPDRTSAADVWASSAAAADEALGGALLTPIPWLRRSSPPEEDGSGGGGASNNNSQGSSSSSSPPSSHGGGPAGGAQIHSESTETIDGPNGVGRIETVSVSINGISSTTGGGHARGVTQGELLRQEQRAGVVPVSQLSRSHDAAARSTAVSAAEGGRDADDEGTEREGDEARKESEDGGREDEQKKEHHEDEEHEDEETPHARGPEEIGAGDIGPQSATTSFVGEGGMESHDIDVEAAVGRRQDEEQPAEAEAGAEAGADAVGSAPGEAGHGAEDKATGHGEGAEADENPAAEAGTKRSPERDGADAANKKLKEDGEDHKMD